MPWKEMDSMEQKIFFIGDYLRGTEAFSNLCARYSISRKTGYKWLGRYQVGGVSELAERSRRPKAHPHKIPHSIRKAIIELRTDSLLTPGAKKIQVKLKELFPDIEPPALSTINNILSKAGLSEVKRRRQRYDRYKKPLVNSNAPNDLWSVDFKGQFRIRDHELCYPLTVMDDNSRYLLGVNAQLTTRGDVTHKAFERLFREYGLPERIRSDNGVPFASRATAGLSKLSVWWIRLGIHPERIAPGKPQQNGKHERMHRTLKKHAAYPSTAGLKAQQKRFDAFRQAYNQDRPHEALDMQTPGSRYQASPRRYPISFLSQNTQATSQ